MKDYSLTKKEAKEFILYFNEAEEELIIYYASGEVERRKNTSKNKRNILKKMEKQVGNTKKFKKQVDKKIMLKQIEEIFFTALRLVNVIYLIVAIFNFSPYTLLYLILVLSNHLAVKAAKKTIKECKEILKDVEKNEMYLEFSKIREKEASRILGEVREELKEKGATKKQIEEIPETLENIDDEININTVHKMEYLEMKQLLENAKTLKNIEFFSQTEQEKTEEKEGERTFQEKWEEYKPPKEKEVYTFQRRWKIMRAKEEQNSK